MTFHLWSITWFSFETNGTAFKQVEHETESEDTMSLASFTTSSLLEGAVFDPLESCKVQSWFFEVHVFLFQIWVQIFFSKEFMVLQWSTQNIHQQKRKPQTFRTSSDTFRWDDGEWLGSAGGGGGSKPLGIPALLKCDKGYKGPSWNWRCIYRCSDIGWVRTYCIQNVDILSWFILS